MTNSKKISKFTFDHLFVILYISIRSEHIRLSSSDQRPSICSLLWLDQDTVHIATVLCNALCVYKRFQKLIQGDQITIFDLQSLCDHCIIIIIIIKNVKIRVTLS